MKSANILIGKTSNGETIRELKSRGYNYKFNYNTGFFARWGKTKKKDPLWSPFGPEIADIEITTSCTAMCPWCYKANTKNGKYMSFETFKVILDKFPNFIDNKGIKHWYIMQIAFGVDSECKTNPDVWKIFKYCRDNGIVPNLTVAKINKETAENISKYAGACAVSRYSDKNNCYDSIDLLTNTFGMKQVNIHQLVSEENYNNIIETLHDIQIDPRLKNLNAIVFLLLKKKGRGTSQTILSDEKYREIIRYCQDNKISYGSDSCGAHKLLCSLNYDEQENLNDVIEDCESTRFSIYVDVDGKCYPCSFMANEESNGWKTGIDLLSINNFFKDVWNNSRVNLFRNEVIITNNSHGGCCYFKV